MEGVQEKHKMHAAQEIMQKTMTSVEQGTLGSTKEVTEALSKVEQVLESEAKSAPDHKSEKAVSDMAKFVGAAEQVIVEKDIGDRLQRISKEAELAQIEQDRIAKHTTLSSEKTTQAQTHAKILANNFGPLFQLILSSYEFRQLVLDFVKISRTVFLRSIRDDVGTRVERQWLSGRDASEIAKDVANTTIGKMQTEEGKIELLVTENELEVLEDDLLELFAVIARDERYHEGISRMFDLSEIMYEESQPISSKLDEATRQPHTQKLQEETKELISQFTGRESLERFLDRLRILTKRLRDDPETRNYLTDMRHFILETKNPERVRSEEFKRRTRDLVERGRRLMDRLRYKPEVEAFLDSVDELIDNLKDDELVATLRERAGILLDDLTYEDIQGNRQLDTQVLGNIRKVIVPVLADALKYIPIPRIEDSNYKRDYAVDNVVLCGYDVIPENVFVHLESDSWVSVRELETERSRTRLIIALRNIRTELKDVQFYFKRKVFPKMEDAGRVSLRIGGRGATLTVTFRVDQLPGEAAAKFTGGHVDFHIDDMDIDFDRATLTHDILVPMITGLFKRNIIHSIERGVEKSLGGIVNDIGLRLSESLIGENRFSKQLEYITESVKHGEFSRRYRKRQEKLE